MKWKWGNVPVPAQHLGGLVLGAILQAIFPRPLLSDPVIGVVLGLVLAAIGAGIAIWSVAAAGDIDVESPQRLVTAGPYAYSRNPMMVAWTSIYLGLAFIINSVWIVALVVLVVLFTHFVDIRMEERFLARKFGNEYLEYQRRVRRYI